MSSFASFSSRTKRRKLAAAVEAFRLSCDANDCINEPKSMDGINLLGESNEPLMLNDNENDFAHYATYPRTYLYPESGNSSDEDLGWSHSDEQAFEMELEDCDKCMVLDDNNIIDGDENEKCVSTQELAEWAVRNKITHTALRELLHMMRRQNDHLPKDPRTLLGTPSEVSITTIGSGSYHYLGVQNCFNHIVTSSSMDVLENMEEFALHINVDGIPLFSSSKVTLWPILGMFPQINSSPFPIALYCGPSKPLSMDEFLKDFIQEMTTGGFKLKEKEIKLNIAAVICDAPARAMLKCCKPHTAYSCCERCVQKGRWRRKITFSTTRQVALRTDTDFRQQSDPVHHVGISPLLTLPLGLVSQFPLDYMHVVCLGVVRRMIFLWSSPKGPTSCRLSTALLKAVSDRLLTYRSFMPRQFARKPRSVSEVKMWKATEFRTFLLYLGPVALKGLLSNELYDNFLCLSVAMSICLDPEVCTVHTDYCEHLFHFFVHTFSKLYGKSQVVYNVHCLTHLVDDVRRYGCLENISAFPFENCLGHLKKMVRKPNNPVSQIVNRLKEGELSKVCTTSGHDLVNLFKKLHFDGPVPCGMTGVNQYRQYDSQKLFLSCDCGDNCVEVDGKIGIVRNIMSNAQSLADNSCWIVFSHFEQIESLYTQPMLSEKIGIYLLSKLSETCTHYSSRDVKRKYMLIPMASGIAYAGFPLQASYL